MKLVVTSMAAAVAAAAATVALAPQAGADTVAYLVNVHVRPGYNFPNADAAIGYGNTCLLYTSPSPRDRQKSRMPSSA